MRKLSTSDILIALDKTPELVSDDLFLAAMPFGLSIDEKLFTTQMFQGLKNHLESVQGKKFNTLTGTVKNEGEVWMRTVDPGPMSGAG